MYIKNTCNIGQDATSFNSHIRKMKLAIIGTVILTFFTVINRGFSQTTAGCVANYHLLNGECTECPVGFYGINCNSRCPKNYFGKNCLETCDVCEWAECDPVIGCRKGDVCDEICKYRRDQPKYAEYTSNVTNCTCSLYDANTPTGSNGSPSLNGNDCGLHLALTITGFVLFIVSFLANIGLVLRGRKQKAKLSSPPPVIQGHSLPSSYYSAVNEERMAQSCYKPLTTGMGTFQREDPKGPDGYEVPLNTVDSNVLGGADVDQLTTQIYEKLLNSDVGLTCEYSRLRELIGEEITRVVK